MNLRDRKSKCGNYFRLVNERISNREVKEPCECYAESYLKGFCGMCDNQPSSHSFVTKSNGQVITNQPQLKDPSEAPITLREEVALSN